MMGLSADERTFWITCPGCWAWQADVDRGVVEDPISALEEELAEHVRTEGIGLLRLPSDQYEMALAWLAPDPSPLAELSW